MELKELNKRINALASRNDSIYNEIQALGLACLQHGASEAHGGFGDVMPLNRLFNVLKRSQAKPFTEWALAFGMVKRNTDKQTKVAMPFTYDRSRSLDIEGATAKTWDEFAPEKSESVAKAFDLQAAVMVVLKRAAAAGQPESVITALANAAGIDAAKIPKAISDTAETAIV